MDWHLPEEVLTATTCSFVEQLLQNKQAQQAALVAATIRDDSLRTQLLFKVAQYHPDQLEAIATKINLPKKMLDSVRALHGGPSRWDLWLSAGNSKVAERVYSEDVLPSLLRKVPLDQLRQLWCLEDSKFNGLQRQAESQLTKIKNEYKSADWETTIGGLYLRAVNA